MSFRTRLRQFAFVLVALALLNAPFAAWVYATNPGLSKPDSTHTFGISNRGIGKLFYTTAVGAYLILSFSLGAAAAGSLALWRIFPEKDG